ncbi:MAG: cytochrome c maturation protein CcmE [Candidatus Thorarchaeota archaeon]|nr:cytochrome c maturation protein CcmE [Candidatus Thorarchaeota archaeon]
MKKKTRVLAISAIMIVTVAAVAYTMMNTFVDPYIGVDAVVENPDVYRGRTIQVKGKLLAGSLSVTLDNTTLVILGVEHSLLVLVEGVLPDLTDAQDIVAIGTLDPAGFIIAENLLAQCPSKYETNSTTTGG